MPSMREAAKLRIILGMRSAGRAADPMAYVYRSLRVNGLEGTRQKWENHWRNAVSDADFDWLVNAARCRQ